MRIENIRKTVNDDQQEVRATIHWEDNPAAPFEMYFAIPVASELQLEPLADPFVLACYTRAFDNGERRLVCDAPISEGLAAAMRSALGILIHWNLGTFSQQTIPALELTTRPELLTGERGIAAFYSGGVDSTHLLVRNARENPVATAGRINHAIAVYGLDMGKSADSTQEGVFAEFLSNAEPLLSNLGLRATPLRTNLRHLDPTLRHFIELSAAFDLAACAMLFAPRVRGFLIANPGEPLTQTVQKPQSLHPIIHQYLSSGDVQIRTPYVEVSRPDRIREIADSDEALRALRVCFFGEDQALNCGRCEKCVRTMLAFHVNDISTHHAFPTELTPELVRGAYITSAAVAQMHEELLHLLEVRGDHALAAAEKRILRSWTLRNALATARSAVSGRRTRSINGNG